jgi:aminoglycoside phosphotransferase (APT) family kinase protein
MHPDDLMEVPASRSAGTRSSAPPAGLRLTIEGSTEQMALMPAAEIDISNDLVQRLLSDQFPDLARQPLVRVANGWDNVTFKLGGELAIRLPRREAAAELLVNEQQWLPSLAPGLPVAVPAPVRCGTPSSYYPWSWSVVPWLEGRAAWRLSAEERRSLAPGLAAFVAALHVPAPSGAPVNPVRGVPLAARSAAVLQRLDSGAVPQAERVAALWRQLSAMPAWEGSALWLHGDLHPGNLVVEGTRLAAVIDFGDITAGDPATDLAAAWLVFDAVGRREFIAAVESRTDVSPESWQRGRGWALAMATALLTSSDDNRLLRSVGERALAEVLSGN